MNLKPIEQRPFNAETPLEALAEPITPTPLFYVRNHFDVPRLNADTWRLKLDGEVEQPIQIGIKDLLALPSKTITVVMECAGNGRALMKPTPPGTPWRVGAVSSATFTGASLSYLINRATLKKDAVEFILSGADEGEVAPHRITRFARSLAVAVCLHPDTILAWEMNGEPLTPNHGFPVRLVVPNWYGVASVKWLVHVSAVATPFDGYFQKERYIYEKESGTRDGTPLSLMRVRSLIVAPNDGAVVSSGPVEVSGIAWSGFGAIKRVQVSADGGKAWDQATLEPRKSDYGATLWRLTWAPPASGHYTLVARA
ncbi:MAG: sulfite oxidase, partial [bacterium]